MLNDGLLGPISPELYEVFVAGIPASTSLEMLRNFFQGFGPVFSIEFIKLDKRRRTNRQPRKFCKLTTTSRGMFHHLIGAPLQFKGRSLFCQQFMSGDSLLAYSTDINARRVVVKKVPVNIGTDELKEALEFNIGSIDIIYQYKSDFAYFFHNSKDHKTFSVTFSDCFASLQLHLKRRFFDLPSGARVEIEQFSYNRYREDRNRDRSRNGPLPDSSKDISSSESKTKTLNQGGKHRLVQTKPSEADKIYCQCSKATLTSMLASVEKPTQSLIEVKIKCQLGYLGKPTVSKYHRFHKHLPHTISTCRLHPSNIRLNLAIPPTHSDRFSSSYTPS